MKNQYGLCRLHNCLVCLIEFGKKFRLVSLFSVIFEDKNDYEFWSSPPRSESYADCGVCEGRGYQKLGENITKGVPDQHEAIDVQNCRISLTLSRPVVRFKSHIASSNFTAILISFNVVRLLVLFFPSSHLSFVVTSLQCKSDYRLTSFCQYFKEFEPTKPFSRSENPLIGLNQW